MNTTTKILFIDSAATTTEVFKRGKLYDVDPKFASAMISSGAAKSVEETNEVDSNNPPTATVMDLGLLAYYLRIDDDIFSNQNESTTLNGLLAAGVEYAETATQSSLTPRTITAVYYKGDVLVLPRGPVTSIVSVTNGDSSSLTSVATLQTEGNTDSLTLPSGWSAPLTVVYTAGYSAVPADILQAIRVHVGSMYENRESVSDRQMSAVPHSP